MRFIQKTVALLATVGVSSAQLNCPATTTVTQGAAVGTSAAEPFPSRSRQVITTTVYGTNVITVDGIKVAQTLANVMKFFRPETERLAARQQTASPLSCESTVTVTAITNFVVTIGTAPPGSAALTTTLPFWRAAVRTLRLSSLVWIFTVYYGRIDLDSSVKSAIRAEFSKFELASTSAHYCWSHVGIFAVYDGSIDLDSSIRTSAQLHEFYQITARDQQSPHHLCNLSIYHESTERDYPASVTASVQRHECYRFTVIALLFLHHLRNLLLYHERTDYEPSANNATSAQLHKFHHSAARAQFHELYHPAANTQLDIEHPV
ncbi:uncharacterized protein MYCGRDRAFT_92715 [Zymoseptoria tritici IPO323]|uniref:Uncharacterized protein n=1 Tax=Zymoseptoria tritici (strain CBS 115943 / IPO323) TaxID=336722 RepID=F9X9S1_ZYMTI|nr:uncharacterized protein MYCGRDRAFT_92715 [Zymoseptoria tritici IPO323]EGP88060.1 hypothetical protein MYCGRDRAFT_92715 [Zymoseptoria tritici IPO323]